MKSKTATDGATIKMSASLAEVWKVTLGGSVRAIQLLQMDDGDMMTVTLIQDSTGGRTVTWEAEGRTIVWTGGQAPILNANGGASNTFYFVRQGSIIRQIGGASAAVRRIVNASGQAVSMAVGATALIVALMANSGGAANPGASPDIANYFSGSGCTLLLTGTGSAGPCSFIRRDTGSGMILLSSSGSNNVTGIGFGVPNLKATSKLTDANGYINNQAEATFSGATVATDLTVRRTISGVTLTVSGVGGAAGRIPCYKDGGVLGYQTVSATGTLAAGGCQ
jgi:hypothetical protein